MGKQSRGTLPKEAVEHLKNWLFLHFQHPYPSEDEKAQLAEETSLTLVQVNNWFINARRRLWKPIIEKQTLKDGTTQPVVVVDKQKQHVHEAVKVETLEERPSTTTTNLPITNPNHTQQQLPPPPLYNIQDLPSGPVETKLKGQNNSTRSGIYSEIQINRPSIENVKPIQMHDIQTLYGSSLGTSVNIREKIERAEKELSQALTQLQWFSGRSAGAQRKKQLLFEKWERRDTLSRNPLSLDEMKTGNTRRPFGSLPIGLEYVDAILSNGNHGNTSSI